MERVRIPTDLNEEDHIFSWGPVKLSLRQLLILAFGVLLWYGAADMMLRPIFGLNLAFGMLACSWIMVISLILTFASVRGRPVDVWFAEKIAFHFGARTFVLKDPNHRGTGVQADLERDEDMEALLDYQRNSRRDY